MAQTTILASGTTAAASTDIVVSAGSVVKVAIFSTNPGESLAGRGFEIFDVTPAAENLIGYLPHLQIPRFGVPLISTQVYTNT